jgi:hypothetical protein
MVADGELTGCESDTIVPDLAGLDHVVPGSGVEVANRLVVSGEHQCLAAVLDGGPPVVDEALAALVRLGPWWMRL